jgi:hypothetical protein
MVNICLAKPREIQAGKSGWLPETLKPDLASHPHDPDLGLTSRKPDLIV